jgi:hypothetical protein
MIVMTGYVMKAVISALHNPWLMALPVMTAFSVMEKTPVVVVFVPSIQETRVNHRQFVMKDLISVLPV